MVTTYVRTLDNMYRDPTVPIEAILDVATGTEATTERAAIGQFRANGFRQTGRVVMTRAFVTSVKLASDPNATPVVVPSVEATVCVRVSDVNAFTIAGKSVVAPGRKAFLLEKLTLINSKYPNPASWRVSNAPNQGTTTCVG